MKFITTLLLAALMAYAIGIYSALPWWSFAITNLIVAIAIPQKPLISFLSGALSIGLLWACLSMIIDQSNHHILATKGSNHFTHERFLCAFNISDKYSRGLSGWTCLLNRKLCKKE
jgi:hypothetical protein